MNAECLGAEAIAGAVALGEATDAQRETYRRHLAGCRRCVTSLCGEREIERVVRSIWEARESESWEPDLRAALQARTATRRTAWTFGLAGALVALGIVVGLHSLNAIVPTKNAPRIVAAEHIVPRLGLPGLVHAVAAAAVGHVAANNRGLVVVHNVVTLNRPASTVEAKVSAVAPVAHPSPAPAPRIDPNDVAALTPTQRDENAIAALRTTATATPASARAESLQLVPNAIAVRDVMPLGGDSAIVPHPSAIAYDEGAEGTTAFEVSVDERGTPVKCTITKPSGYLVLDVSVCKAAMHAHYAPRTINGHPAPGIYRDAFTFRASDNE
jgi:TonB family protein